jgi:hypothetical protein
MRESGGRGSQPSTRRKRGVSQFTRTIWRRLKVRRRSSLPLSHQAAPR